MLRRLPPYDDASQTLLVGMVLLGLYLLIRWVALVYYTGTLLLRALVFGHA